VIVYLSIARSVTDNTEVQGTAPVMLAIRFPARASAGSIREVQSRDPSIATSLTNNSALISIEASRIALSIFYSI
jgi:hypothetical protein